MAQRQMEIGYEGGVVLRLKLDDEAAAAVTTALPEGGWQQVSADGGEHWINLAKVVYLRLDDAPVRVGFGGS